MSPLKEFIEQEEREKVRGQGDMFEAAAVGRVTNVKIYESRTDDLIAELGEQGIILRNSNSQFVPVICFTQFTKDVFVVVGHDDEYAYVRLSLPDEDKLKILANFESHAVILPKQFPNLVAAKIPDEHYGEFAKGKPLTLLARANLI